MSTQQLAFMVHCTTGCSCCSDQNHWCGPFSSMEVAVRWTDIFRDTKHLTSQYAPNGRYTVSAHSVAFLPDGRLIVDDRVFRCWADDYIEPEVTQPSFVNGR